MAANELHVEALLNRRVYDDAGRPVGRIEEIRAVRRGGQCFVSEYRVGTFALLERLAGGQLGRSILQALRLRRKDGGYRVRWDQLDLRDPARPTLRCPVSKKKPVER
jgi:hypothetical protein